MKQKKLYIDREFIQIDENKILFNHWYKLVFYIIQGELYDEEEYLLELLGENEYELLFETVEECISKVASNCFNSKEFSVEFSEIEVQIKKSLLDKIDVEWKIAGKKCNVNFTQIHKRANSYFLNSILPFLQIGKEDELDIICSSISYKKIYENLLIENGYIIADNNKPIRDIKFIQKNSNLIEWLTQNVIIVKNDILGRIPIDINIETSDGKQIERVSNIFFPFYQKGDYINVMIKEQEDKYFLFAENVTKKLQYRNEIKI